MPCGGGGDFGAFCWVFAGCFVKSRDLLWRICGELRGNRGQKTAHFAATKNRTSFATIFFG